MAKLAIIFQITKFLPHFLRSCVAVVAVLQFQNRLYESKKINSIFIINIEVFLGYGNSLKRTATLQQFLSARHFVASLVEELIQERKKIAEK